MAGFEPESGSGFRPVLEGQTSACRRGGRRCRRPAHVDLFLNTVCVFFQGLPQPFLARGVNVAAHRGDSAMKWSISSGLKG